MITAARCPNCGASLDIEEGRDRIKCPYCIFKELVCNFCPFKKE